MTGTPMLLAIITTVTGLIIALIGAASIIRILAKVCL
jgi:hypothetical protein